MAGTAAAVESERASAATLPALLAPEELARMAPPPLIVQVTERETYARGHVPNAVLVEPRELVAGIPPAVGRLPPGERLTALFRRIGYHPDQDVVVLDDEGGGWAGRFAWTLDVIGHGRVARGAWRYLNGGLLAWQAAGLPLATEATAPEPSSVRIRIHHEPIVETEELLRRLDDPALVIWDCRSAEEYRGERRAAARNGHIPGAVNLDWLALIDEGRHSRLVADLGALLAVHGIDRTREVVAHCQTHHRSGLAYMAGRLLGFDRIRAYHGSWSEWGNRPDTPVQSGPG